jgi:hypothetical protein
MCGGQDPSSLADAAKVSATAGWRASAGARTKIGRKTLRRLIAAACAAALAGPAAAETLDHAEFDRVISISAVEMQMYRDADRTPYPDTLDQHPDLFAMGGYRLEPPNEDNEWYARSYHWLPSTIVVNQGERVLLEFFGINGDSHPTEIEGYGIAFEVRRGEITQVELEADKPGIFRMAPDLRLPSMVAQIVVLPNGE